MEAALQWADVVIIATPSMEDDETIKAFASKLEPFVEGNRVYVAIYSLVPLLHLYTALSLISLSSVRTSNSKICHTIDSVYQKHASFPSHSRLLGFDP